MKALTSLVFAHLMGGRSQHTTMLLPLCLIEMAHYFAAGPRLVVKSPLVRRQEALSRAFLRIAEAVVLVEEVGHALVAARHCARGFVSSTLGTLSQTRMRSRIPRERERSCRIIRTTP